MRDEHEDLWDRRERFQVGDDSAALSFFGHVARENRGSRRFTERVYVEPSIFDDFVTRLKHGASGLRVGRPEAEDTASGLLSNEEHRRKVLSHYERAVADWATVVTGGDVPLLSGELEGGRRIESTIWTGLPEYPVVMTAEIFGFRWLNSWFLRDLRALCGGAKASAVGREGGVHSLEFCTETRNVRIQL